MDRFLSGTGTEKSAQMDSGAEKHRRKHRYLRLSLLEQDERRNGDRIRSVPGIPEAGIYDGSIEKGHGIRQRDDAGE